MYDKTSYSDKAMEYGKSETVEYSISSSILHPPMPSTKWQHYLEVKSANI